MTSGPEGANTAGTSPNAQNRGAPSNNGNILRLTQALRDLQQRTGYPLLQENGQRKYGPPPSWEGPPPQKGCEVFVGKIPRDLFEDELVPIMERAGTIYEVRLMMDFPGNNRGYGFVQYTSREEAETALRTLNNYEIRPNRFLGVMRSVDNNRLFVGGIPKSRSKEEVLEEMKRITEGVVKIILYPCVNDRTKNRGYAFVEYTSHKSAAMARRRLFSGRLPLWGNTEVKVDWAEPEIDVDNDTMSKVKVLYIRNLALCTTEDDIRELCHGAASGVERVKKQKDYAFVHFSTREQAEVIKASLNGSTVHGCELEVLWAKPVRDREEYQQRKALARSMVSGSQTQPNVIPHLTPAGESVLVLPQVRRAAGAQGIQHHSMRGNNPRPRPTEYFQTHILGLQGPTVFIPQEPRVKTPNEVVPGYPNGAVQFNSDKVADENRTGNADYILRPVGVVPSGSRSPVAVNSRLMAASHTLRGPPLAPQYIMAPPMSMAPLMTPAMTTATPQSIAVTPGTYLMPTAPLTGYENMNPYALQTAFYQQALMGQPGVSAVERPRFSTTGE